MLELHNVPMADGTKTLDGTGFAPNGLYYTNDSFHETFEVRQGISSWMEASFYVFTSARRGLGWDWVGDHVRSQLRAPDRWVAGGCRAVCRLGYQRPYYAADTWTLEIRPILDEQAGPWYLAFNPAFVRSIHGQNDSKGFAFAPRVKIGRAVTRYISPGVEYYGNYGPCGRYLLLWYQQQQIFPTVDLNLAPDWELNFRRGHQGNDQHRRLDL